MNIQAAIKSGKRFRREGRSFMGPVPTTCGYIQYNDAKLSGLVKLKQEDILAEDWVVEEKKIEITETEFDKAWDIMVGYLSETDRTKLKSVLGFKDYDDV